MENDFRKTRWEEVSPTTTTMTIVFNYSPISLAKFRLLLGAEHAIRQLRPLGYSKEDENELKAILSDNNGYILCGTIFVGGIQVSVTSLSIE